MEEPKNSQDLSSNHNPSMDETSTLNVSMEEISTSTSSSLTTTSTVFEKPPIKDQLRVSPLLGSGSLLKCFEKVTGEKFQGGGVEIVDSVSVNDKQVEEKKQENGGVVVEEVRVSSSVEIRASSTMETVEYTAAVGDNGGGGVLQGGEDVEIEKEIRVSDSSLETDEEGDEGLNVGGVNEGIVVEEGKPVETQEEEKGVFPVETVEEDTAAVAENGGEGVEIHNEIRVSSASPETVEDTAVVSEEEKQDLVVDDEEMVVSENVNGDDEGPVDETMDDVEEDNNGDDVKTAGAKTEEALMAKMVGVGVMIDSSLAAQEIRGPVKTYGRGGGGGSKAKKKVVDLGIVPNMGKDDVVGKGGNEYSASDLVWGKVKSHPWWPGQIFDPQDASKLAKKHQKHDRKRLLVAYFGDQTFAWNVASCLKPFEANFSQLVKQTDMEEFRFAVGSALDEISRRVQRGLICSCVPDEACAGIKTQIITNAGIRAESSRRDGVDKNVGAATLEPSKIVKYVKNFALNPLGGGYDRMENVVTQAQLAAFYRSKGHPRMAEFGFWGGLLDTEAQIPALISTIEEAPSEKRKLGIEDKLPSIPAPSGKKQKSVGSFSDDSAGKTSRERLSQSSNEDGEFRTPGSFKVGESLRRVASQMKGSPPILNSSGGRSRKTAVQIDRSSEKLNEKSKKRKFTIPKEYSDPDEMLSQLHLAARDPMKGYSFLTIIVGFFTDYRNSINLEESSSAKKKSGQPKSGGGGNRKLSKFKANAAEIHSDEEDDPYWTDMISGGTPEEQSPPKVQKRKRKPTPKAMALSKKKSSTVQLEKEPPSSPSLVIEEYSSSDESDGSVYTIDSKQPDPDVSTNLVTEEPAASKLIKNNADDSSPTALVLNFTQAESIPLETDLNKIFSRFGPLMESDTEVTRKTCRAKVVFKSRNDAEAAFSSAGKFSIFGPALASYQLRYLPPTPSAATPCPPSAATPCPPSAASPAPLSTASPEPLSTASPEPVSTASHEPVSTASPGPTLTIEETN